MYNLPIMESPLHGQVRIEAVLKTLSNIEVPLNASCLYDDQYPQSRMVPRLNTDGIQDRDGKGSPIFIREDYVVARNNVTGVMLGLIGVDNDTLNSISDNEAQAILRKGLIGASWLQVGIAAYIDSRRCPARLKTGPFAASAMTEPELLLGNQARSIASLARILEQYTPEHIERISPINWHEGESVGKTSPNEVARGQLLKRASEVFQQGNSLQKDIYYANFTAQDVIRAATSALPEHVGEIAGWAANELQLETDFLFLHRLVDLNYQPLTMGTIRSHAAMLMQAGVVQPDRRTRVEGYVKEEVDRFFDLARRRRQVRLPHIFRIKTAEEPDDSTDYGNKSDTTI